MKISNLKNVPATSEFTPIPAGKYNLIVAKAENKIAKESKNEYISVGFRILDSTPEGVYGRYVFANINGNEIGVQILKSILSYNSSPLAELEGDVEFDPSSLVGMKVSATVTLDTDKDKNQRNNVKYFKPIQDEFVDATLDVFKHESTYNPDKYKTDTDTKDDLPF